MSDALTPNTPDPTLSFSPSALPDRNSVRALRAGALIINLQLVYEEALEQTVFNRRVGVDVKTQLRHKRVLCEVDSYRYLSLINKESRFITDADLAAAGMERSFCGDPLTSNKLVNEVAASPSDVGKLHHRVRNLVQAATCYGLLERTTVRSKLITISGSEALSELMLLVAKRQTDAIFASEIIDPEAQ